MQWARHISSSGLQWKTFITSVGLYLTFVEIVAIACSYFKIQTAKKTK